jgi:DnaK suppressor protein
MTEKQIKKYKEMLLKERTEILKELADSDESVKDLLENDSHNVNDSIDEATTTITQNILNIVSSKSQQTLLAIESALRRIAEGSFGKCITCGSQITQTRLDAIPWATKCIDCKTKDEKRK